MSVTPSTTALESLLKRERTIVISALVLATIVAWAYMIHEAYGMMCTGVCKCMGLAMAGPDTSEWSAPQLLALFLMWSEMMVAMMLPSAAPMLLTFASINRSRREQHRALAPVSAFAAGYLFVWIGFSLVATLLQWALHSAALLSPVMALTNSRLAGTLLLVTGAFQFSPWKVACLARCANPLTFLFAGWREGTGGAMRMGLHQGLFCLGCCWALMLLLFVLGVMNILWIAALTVYVLFEKLLGRSVWFGRAAGAALGVWGTLLLLRQA